MKLVPTLLALAAAGCTTASAPGDRSYSAVGTEPFWSIAIAGGRMTYETPEGSFTVPAGEPVATPGGRRYTTSRGTVDIRPWVCTDGMSDNLYADTVTAIVDGTTLHGCGGGIVPWDVLVDSSWDIIEIGDVALWGDENVEGYSLAFRADRLVGQAGCNRFSGPYSRSGGTLTAGPLATTRMACPGPRMDHERQALAVLGAPVRLEFRDDDTLRMTGPGGTLRLRRSFHAPYAVTPPNPWEPGSR